jgi:hypothetical protein
MVKRHAFYNPYGKLCGPGLTRSRRKDVIQQEMGMQRGQDKKKKGRRRERGRPEEECKMREEY